MTQQSINIVKTRLESACQVYKIYPTPQPNGYQSSLAKTTPTAYENTYFFKPTPQEIDDADTVQFQWLPYLSPFERQLVWKRFSGQHWKTLAFDLNISERTARTYVNKIVKKFADLIDAGTIH